MRLFCQPFQLKMSDAIIPYIPDVINSIVKSSITYTGLGNKVTNFYIHKVDGSNAETLESDIHQITEINKSAQLIKLVVDKCSTTLSSYDASNYTYDRCQLIIWNGNGSNRIYGDTRPKTTDGDILVNLPTTFIFSPIDVDNVFISLYCSPIRNPSASSGSHEWKYQFDISYELTQLYFQL